MLNESDWETDCYDCPGCDRCDPDRCLSCGEPTSKRCDACDGLVCEYCHLGRQCCAVDGDR